MSMINITDLCPGTDHIVMCLLGSVGDHMIVASKSCVLKVTSELIIIINNNTCDLVRGWADSVCLQQHQ